MLRLTGKVTRIDTRSGQYPDKVTGEFKPWSFDMVNVMVADQAIVVVQRFSNNPTPVPVVGQEIDYAVTAEVFRERVTFQVDKPWADLFPKALSAAPVARAG